MKRSQLLILVELDTVRGNLVSVSASTVAAGMSEAYESGR
jgi:hypothetical protein